MDVLLLGEPLICLGADRRLATAPVLAKSVGGAECNVAIGLARLGATAAVIGRVGDDPFGEQIRYTLRGEGVDVTHLGTDASGRPTGLLVKEQPVPGEIRVHYYRHGSAGAALDAGMVPEDLVRGAKRVHTTGITLGLGEGAAGAARRLLEVAHEAGVPTSFDANFRRKLWTDEEAAAACRELLHLVGDLLVSEDEARAIAGTDDLVRAIDVLHGFGPERVVIRRGEKGATGSLKGSAGVTVPPYRVPAVDTVGAGDAFTAGYLYELLHGRTLLKALFTGAYTAAKVVAHPGDYEGFPTMSEYAGFTAGAKVVDR